jgi:hypothetical protein
MVAVVAPGRLPDVGAVATGEREQPNADVAVGVRGRPRERVASLVCERDRPPVADEDGGERGHGDENDAECKAAAKRLRDGDSPLAECESDRGSGADRCEYGEDDGKPMPVVRRKGERRILTTERVVPRGHQRTRRCGSPDDECGSQQLKPAWVDRDRGHKGDCERDPRPAPEREVESRQQHDGQRTGDAARHQRPRSGCQAERQQDAHGSEDPEPVPVAERLGQPVSRDRIEGAETVGEEPRPQAVQRRERDTGEDPSEQRRHRSDPDGQHQGSGDGDVSEHSLGLVHGLDGVDRPRGRQQGPHPERGEAAQEGELEPARPDDGAE